MTVADTRVEKSNKPKWVRGKTYARVMIVFMLLAVIAVGAGIIVSITMFRRLAKAYRIETLEKAVKLASSEIEAEDIDTWLKNGSDSKYEATKIKLQNILDNTPYLQYLYLVQPQEDGFHIVYDLTTNDEELAQYHEVDPSELTIDTVFPYERGLEEHIPAFLSGEEIEIVESNDAYGWLLSKFVPVVDSDGVCRGYVGADISMIGMNVYMNTFTVWVSAISLIFLAAITIVGVFVSSYARRAYEYEVSSEQQERDQKLLQEVIESYSQVVDAKDPYTNGHSSRVAEYAVKIAELAGKSEEECQQIYFTALLHDVGKVGIPASILTKPGRLNDEEFEIIKRHPSMGAQIMKDFSSIPGVQNGIKYHHERYDGKGYNEGLKGEEIPLEGRIICVADSYDAMSSKRCYRNSLSYDFILDELKRNSGTQFDPDILVHMVALVEEGYAPISDAEMEDYEI